MFSKRNNNLKKISSSQFFKPNKPKSKKIILECVLAQVKTNPDIMTPIGKPNIGIISIRSRVKLLCADGK